MHSSTHRVEGFASRVMRMHVRRPCARPVKQLIRALPGCASTLALGTRGLLCRYYTTVKTMLNRYRDMPCSNEGHTYLSFCVHTTFRRYGGCVTITCSPGPLCCCLCVNTLFSLVNIHELQVNQPWCLLDPCYSRTLSLPVSTCIATRMPNNIAWEMAL